MHIFNISFKESDSLGSQILKKKKFFFSLSFFLSVFNDQGFTSFIKHFSQIFLVEGPQTPPSPHLQQVSNTVETRAPMGTDRSPEYNEHFYYKLDSRVKKFDYRMEPKTTTLHNTCF